MTELRTYKLGIILSTYIASGLFLSLDYLYELLDQSAHTYDVLNRNFKIILMLNIFSMLWIKKGNEPTLHTVELLNILGISLVITSVLLFDGSIVNNNLYVIIKKNILFFLGLGLLASWITVYSTYGIRIINKSIFTSYLSCGTAFIFTLCCLNLIIAYTKIPKYMEEYFISNRFYYYIFTSGGVLLEYLIVYTTCAMILNTISNLNKLDKIGIIISLLSPIIIPYMYITRNFGDYITIQELQDITKYIIWTMPCICIIKIISTRKHIIQAWSTILLCIGIFLRTNTQINDLYNSFGYYLMEDILITFSMVFIYKNFDIKFNDNIKYITMSVLIVKTLLIIAMSFNQIDKLYFCIMEILTGLMFILYGSRTLLQNFSLSMKKT